MNLSSRTDKKPLLQSTEFYIDRELYPEGVVLRDHDFHTSIVAMRNCSMTDEQILAAIELANAVYEKGIIDGKCLKGAEIRAALGPWS